MMNRPPHRLSRQERRRQSGPVAVTAFQRAVFDRERGGLPPKTRLILRVIGCAVLLYVFVAGNMGILKMMDLRRSERTLTRRDTRLAAQVMSLDTRRRMLESDTTYIEKVARTEYHLSRPGEVIYEIEKPTP
ncbi:MAG: septum formation initiator family protein [candidate division Zixibacteria bacterium]|nr:septum formation initiator family protein [candidate division Zixibacteria bacterium]